MEKEINLDSFVGDLSNVDHDLMIQKEDEEKNK